MEYSDLEFDESLYYLGTLCYRGHDWNNTGCSVRYYKGGNSKGGCVLCARGDDFDVSGDSRKVGNKFTEDYVGEEVASYGHIYIGGYINIDKPFKVLCGVCGNEWRAYLSHIRNGGMCSDCGRIKGSRNNKRRLSREVVEKIFEDRGFVFLDDSDKAMGSRRLRYLCSCGRIGFSYLYDIRHGSHCFACGNEKIREKNISRRRMVPRVVWPAICSYCGMRFEATSGGTQQKIKKGLPVCCSRQCGGLYRRLRVKRFCSICGESVVRSPSQFPLSGECFCSIECKGKFYSGVNAPAYVHGECVGGRSTSAYTKKAHYKRRHWKGEMEIIRSGRAPDIVVVKGMEIVDKFSELQMELNHLYREKKWKEYIMALLRAMQAHEDHLLDLIDGEVRYPQFRLRDINRTANTQLGFYREHRKEVVTNAFNHPDEIPALIEL